MVPHAVEQEVVMVPACGEILLGVINHVVCAQRSDQVYIPRTTDASHLCTQRLGDLHGEGPHASRRTVHQDCLPRLKVSHVAKTLQGGECCYRDGSRLLEREVVWLLDHG